MAASNCSQAPKEEQGSSGPSFSRWTHLERLVLQQSPLRQWAGSKHAHAQPGCRLQALMEGPGQVQCTCQLVCRVLRPKYALPPPSAGSVIVKKRQQNAEHASCCLRQRRRHHRSSLTTTHHSIPPHKPAYSCRLGDAVQPTSSSVTRSAPSLVATGCHRPCHASGMAALTGSCTYLGPGQAPHLGTPCKPAGQPAQHKHSLRYARPPKRDFGCKRQPCQRTALPATRTAFRDASVRTHQNPTDTAPVLGAA